MFMYNNRAITVLRDLGIWIPGYPVTDKEAAFCFWAEVFGWEAEATTKGEKLHRLAHVENLVANLDWSTHPEFRIYIKGEYYSSNRDLVKRFWRIVEQRVELKDLLWYWVQTERKHKGLCWGKEIPKKHWVIKNYRNTPQRREETKVVSETPQGGGFNSIDEVL